MDRNHNTNISLFAILSNLWYHLSEVIVMRPLLALLAFLCFSMSISGKPRDIDINAPEDVNVHYSVEETGPHTYQLDIAWD